MLAMLSKKNEYKKFDLMMRVIELLKNETGYIFRVYIIDQNDKVYFIINKNELNRKKIAVLSELVEIPEQHNKIDVTNYYLDKIYGSTNYELVNEENVITIIDKNNEEII